MSAQESLEEIPPLPFGLNKESRISIFETVSENEFNNALSGRPGAVSFGLTLFEKPCDRLLGTPFLEAMGLGGELMLPPIDIGKVPSEHLTRVPFMKHFLDGQANHISTVYLVVGYSMTATSFQSHLTVLMTGRESLRVVLICWFDHLQTVVSFNHLKEDIKYFHTWPMIESEKGDDNHPFFSWLFHPPFFQEKVEKVFIPLNKTTSDKPIINLKDKRIYWEVNELKFPIPIHIRDIIFPTVLYAKHKFNFFYGVSDRLKRLYIEDFATLTNVRNVREVPHLALKMDHHFESNTSKFRMESFMRLVSLQIDGNPDNGLTIDFARFPSLRRLSLQNVSSKSTVRSTVSDRRLLETLDIINSEVKLRIGREYLLNPTILRLNLQNSFVKQNSLVRKHIIDSLMEISYTAYIDPELVKPENVDLSSIQNKHSLEHSNLPVKNDDSAEKLG